MTFYFRPSRMALGVLFLGSILLGTLGCGGGGGGDNVVSGTVKFNGQPVLGSIMFVSQKDPKNVSSTIIQDNGRYQMPKAPLGMVDVAFQPTTQSSDPKAPPPPQLPEKYLQAKTSGLSFEVKGGRQTKDFILAP
ncbi:MAG TPA: hypothetical protein VMG10_28940 [Gemmataceae bacterium]|nr:hypothetical protein [Gemmataceae bacterium]